MVVVCDVAVQERAERQFTMPSWALPAPAAREDLHFPLNHFAASPDRLASISSMASMAWSNCSSERLETGFVCSSFISFGTHRAQIFK
jgi:hypothetical protein